MRAIEGAAPARPGAAPERRGGVSLGQTVQMAWRAILGNKARSLLTALGVIIGVAAVIVLTAVGAGSTASITASLQSLGTNLLTVSSFRGFGGGGGIVRGAAGQTITLDDAEAIAAFDPARIRGVAPADSRNLQAKVGAQNLNVNVTGTWPDYASVRNSQPATGAFFTAEDLRGRRRVAVVGHQVVTDLFGGADPVGQKIKLGNVSFTVIGTLPDKGNSGFGNPNAAVLVPLSTFQQRLGRGGQSRGKATVSQVYVQAASKEDLTPLQGDLEDLIAARHRLDNPDEYDFSVQNQADTLETLNSVTRTLTLFLGGVAGISLLVGGIGIMNIMLVSVTERTREIGVRKALGARPRDILMQFLVEAFVLSVGGGLIGILAGVGLAFTVGPALGSTPVVSMGSIVAAFVFSAAVGIFFGLYPAARAARLDPVDSLRYE